MNFLEVSYSRKQSLDVPLPCSKYWKAAEDVPTVVQVFQRGELNVSQASMNTLSRSSAECVFLKKPYENPVKRVTLWLFNIAMGNDPFIDGLPIKSGDFPWLC